MVMFSDEQLFLWDIDALQEISKYPHAKNLLSASVILRRLLTDSGQPLVHRICRKLNMKPTFKLFSKRKKEDFQKFVDTFPAKESLICVYLNPDPSITDTPSTNEVGLDEFLASPITAFEGKILTVKEIINYVANVGGGVHQGKPTKRDNAETIHRTANSIWMNGLPYPLENLRNIINITIAGLTPQRDRLRA